MMHSYGTHMAMNFVVRKSTPIVVRPLEPVTTSGSGSLIKLSSFDKIHGSTCTVLLAFEHPIHETVETIRRALSQALVHYYPFAGRLVAAADSGDVAPSHIQCSGDGVVFVAASASCALEEIISSNELPHELAVHYQDEHRCGGALTHDRPLLLMQVTEFWCGGFVLGVTWHHAVTDGAGMGQFLQAIGELARGLPSPAVVPIRSVDSLPELRADKVVELVSPHMVPFSHLACLNITVPSSLVGRIKDEFRVRFNGQACTVFDIVTALMWQLHTRATMSDPDAPALLLFAANVRRHVGLKEGYYGNCMTMEIVMAKSGMVAQGDTIDLVKLINKSKEKIGEQFKNNTGSSYPQQYAGQVAYNVILITSWRNLGLHEPDFGSGRPAQVVHCHCAPEDLPCVPVFFLLPDCKGKDTSLSVTVKQEHAEAFLRELASFTSLTTVSSVTDAHFPKERPAECPQYVNHQGVSYKIPMGQTDPCDK